MYLLNGACSSSVLFTAVVPNLRDGPPGGGGGGWNYRGGSECCLVEVITNIAKEMK